MLSFEQIKELIELVAQHRLHTVEIERSGFRCRIDGEAPAAVQVPVVAPAPVPATPAAAPVPAAGGDQAVPEPAPDTHDWHEMTSPIVGTFYAAPSPDAGPFVSVGDTVQKGQVLCIVEAMKLMNEIESDVNGVVREVLPKNAQPVEFGEPLFRIEAS